MTFAGAQWPKWVGCAMAAHENLAGGLIGLGGALFAAWLAYSGAQLQLRNLNEEARKTARLRAEERFNESAAEIDALKLAKGYLNAFTDNFPKESDPNYLTFNFEGMLIDLNERAHVYVSLSATSAPRGFGRSIKTVMWRMEKIAETVTKNRYAPIGVRRDFTSEIQLSIEGIRQIEVSIDRLLPSLEARAQNLYAQMDVLSGS
jgi:hypothetical protein